MKEGEGPALKSAARTAEIKAWGNNTERLEGCASYLRRRTIDQNTPFT